MRGLPSKKFLVVAIAALIVLGAWFLVSYKSNSNNNNNSPGKFSYISSLFKSNDKDSDNDGLMDWEEALWKTDPKNPDTDGDGTLDGQEVSQGRDPLKPGPDDKLEDVKIFSQENISEASELTKTDILARDFFANFLALQQSGNLNQENKEKLTDFFLASIAQEKLIDKYSISDLNLIGTNKESLKNYGNDIGKIIKEYNSSRNESDMEVINRFVQSQSEANAKEIDFLIKLYQNTAQKLLIMTVPQSLTQYNLSLLNSMFNFSEALKNIQQIFKDPVWAMIGIQQYQQEYLRIERSLQDISRYFTQEEIFFNQNDNGYYIFVSNRK